MVRSILAVVAGFFLIGALAFGTDLVVFRMFPQHVEGTRVTHAGILVLMFAYVGLYATFGCWLCARLAPSRPMRHALVLGALGLAFNVVGSIARWDDAPAWFHGLALATTMLWAWLGGRIAERQLAGAAPAAPAVA